MRLEARGNKWIAYGEDGYIIVITTHKGIALNMLKNHLNSTQK